MKHLFLSPHPDDVEIGCGGLVHALASRAGSSVALAVCTGPGDVRMQHSGDVVSFETRKREQEAAARKLGPVDLIWLDLAPASKFDLVPQTSFVSAFEEIFRGFDTVYIPLPSFNNDHRVVWESALTAVRPLRPRKKAPAEVFAYEQAFANAMPPAAPPLGRVYVPLLEEDIEAKKEALRQHKSQIAGRDMTIYGSEGVELLARTRGLEIGQKYAEMLYLVRHIRPL